MVTSILDIERAAARLRSQLRLATLPELKLLCGLRFLGLFTAERTPGLESYAREFVPTLAVAARKCNPREFLPEEATALSQLITLLESQSAVEADDLDALRELQSSFVEFGRTPWDSTTPRDDGATYVSNAKAFDLHHPKGEGTHRGDSSEVGSRRAPLPRGEGARRAGEGKQSSRAPSHVASGGPTRRTDGSLSKLSAAVTCLFVEYYPDLDLPPRGRCLTLNVTATPISSKVEADDIVVRNPVSEPDDRFLTQARDSVTAARAHLARRYGLSLRKRYRFDFAVDSTGARFTGDSLGVAFAVGAMAAIGKIEVFREKISLRTDVAFTGALSADGRLAPIDADALKLKIYRAFHSGLRFLVIPRAHITDAWAYLKELEASVHDVGRTPWGSTEWLDDDPVQMSNAKAFDLQLPRGEGTPSDTPANPLPQGESAPAKGGGEGESTSPPERGRIQEGVIPAEAGIQHSRLELVGADHLDAVATDPRLLPTERSSAPTYAARKAWKAKRSAWVEVPLLLALIAILAAIIVPRWIVRNPASVRLTPAGFEVFNRWDKPLWSKAFPCDSIQEAECWAVRDLDGDGLREVLFMPQTRNVCSLTAKLHVYNWKGTLLFSRECVNWGMYPEADSGQKFEVQHLHVAKVRGESVIITDTHRSNPSQAHIRLWDRSGNLKGWYVNAGAAHFQFAKDWDGDGREDLLFKGNQIRMDGSTVFVIRADSCYGASPPYADSEYNLAGVVPGNQLHYMVFPRSEVARALDFPYASPGDFTADSDSTFRFDVGQSRIRNMDSVEVTGYLMYYLDARLRVTRVDLEDHFKTHRARAIARKLLPEQSLEDFKDQARDTVMFWIDSGWVSEGQLRAAGK